jgi:hypothetical protein
MKSTKKNYFEMTEDTRLYNRLYSTHICHIIMKLEIKDKFYYPREDAPTDSILKIGSIWPYI